MINDLLKRLLIVVIFGSSLQAVAGTTIEYEAHCNYVNAKNVLKYSGTCKANWGVGMFADNLSQTYQRYIITYPNGAEIVVFTYGNNEGVVNDIPAKLLAPKNGLERIKTVEGERFEFTKGSEF